MSFSCELIEREEQPAIALRVRLAVQDLPNVIGPTYMRIMQYLGELGEQPAGEPFVAYYNLDMQDLDVEIGFPVLKALPGKMELQPARVPGGKHGVCHYTGPYEEMEPAYNALNQFIKDQGYEPTGVAYEYYLNGPQTAQPSEYQTRIEFPLK